MKNILLVSPASDNEALWGTEIEDLEVKNNMVPLGLATVAGLTPENITVNIWDENVHGLISTETEFDADYELVGITGYKAHLHRCRQLARIFRKRGILVAVGGPGVSSTPDHYRGDFDILFIGEAEITWPQFLIDWENNCYQTEYRQIEKPDLTLSPQPDWSSISQDLSKYAMGCVQTTRGCPFDCEFCDVIYLFGRRPRHKPIKKVLEEIKVLQRLGLPNIFISDDEFIGDPKYARDLLYELVDLNKSFDRPLTFSTQVTVNVSRKEKLLKLLADANFTLLYIGIETPNEASIKETNKHQNLSQDPISEIHKILSYGIAIRAGIIVGFDHDSHDIFDTQFDFIQKSCLPSLTVNMLKAPLGTRLYARLRQEGRVVSLSNVKNQLGHPRSYTNIVPKMMTRVELLEGYKELLGKIYSWESFEQRMIGFVSLVQHRLENNKSTTPTKELRDFKASMKIGPDGTRAIERIISHTLKEAPWLMDRVRGLIIQHYKYCESLDTLLFQIDRQIELESRGELRIELDDRPIPIPPAFIKSYQGIFPEVYKLVHSKLNDKNQTPAALVQVFVDFIVRWGEGFKKFEAYHLSFLKEICDKVCEKLNDQIPDKAILIDSAETSLPNFKRLRMNEDIIKSVEQELIRIK
jgi:hypothetical protein